MNIVLSSVLPVVLLLVIGNLLRRFNFVQNVFWQQSDRITYFVLFPALMITKLSEANLSAISTGKLYASVLLFFLIMSGIVYVIYKTTCTRANQFSSVYQALTRFNSYLYLALAAELWGQAHLSYVVLLVGIVVPTVNVLCVLSFSLGGKSTSLKSIVKSLLTNPLIVGCLIGFAVNLYPKLLPLPVFNTLEILSRAALPLALLSVGAAVRVRLVFDRTNTVRPLTLWLSTLGRLFIAPLVYWGIAWAFGFDDITTQTLVLFAAVPSATSAYILAKQMGGDVELIVTTISLQTLLSIGSLVVWLLLLM